MNLAPNGKPSNLTPEQYKLVRTPEFKAWFGDWENSPETSSKVVDENGEPMPMYHGTQYGYFTEFDKSKVGTNYKDEPFGFYFTNIKSPNQLKGYSAEEYATKGDNPYVFEVFLNIKNPIEQEVFSERPAESIDWEHNKLRNQIQKSIFNSITKGSRKIDGVIAESRLRKTKEIIAVALKSNQIKLADGTNTTFDGNNPDIRFMAGGKVNVVDIKQYNIGDRNYRFVEIAEKKYNKIELYRQADDGNYYGHLLYRRVPRYDAEFSSPMVNDINQLYAYEPVSDEELFNAVKNKKKPFASFGYWLSYNTEEEIQKKIQPFIDECDKYNLEYAVEKISDENPRLERIQFQVCQKGTFDELFDIDALLEDYFINGFDLYDVENIIEFRDVEISYFLNNEWDENYALTGLILGIPPKFTMGLINMGTTYGLGKKYDYTENVIVVKNNNSDIRFKKGGSVLLAPNGKPSNLTDEQYKLVRTKAFKDWFGDWENDPENASKVVDENGEPLVLNHSTRKNQKEDGSYEDYFDIDSWLQERGNYLFSTPNSSVNPIFLSRKGKYALSDDIWQIKFFANIKNLFDTDNKNHLKKLQEYTIKTYSKYGDYNEMAEDLYGGGYETFEVDYKIGEKRNKWENSGSIPALISEMGYDAYINNDENVIVVFDRNKLKLADGTNTTFDGNNPDIRYAGGGEVDSLNYFDSTTCEFKPISSEDSIEILNQYAKWRRLKIKPQFIYSSKYGNLRIDYESEKKNAFFQSRSLSYYFVSENDDFVIRISDHWSKSNYEKSRKLNCGYIRSVSWTNYGEKFHYRLPAQSYGSDLIGGICYFKDFNKE